MRSQKAKVVEKAPIETNSENDDENVIEPPSKKSKNYNCDQCSETFPSLTIFRKHNMHAHRKRKVYKCKPCSEIFTANALYQKHYKAVHWNRGPDGEPKTYECDPCSETFDSILSYRVHNMKAHRTRELKDGKE